MDKLSNGTATPKDWMPTLNPDYNVVSGKVGSLAKDARSLMNPGVPSVMSRGGHEPL